MGLKKLLHADVPSSRALEGLVLQYYSRKGRTCNKQDRRLESEERTDSRKGTGMDCPTEYCEHLESQPSRRCPAVTSQVLSIFYRKELAVAQNTEKQRAISTSNNKKPRHAMSEPCKGRD